MLWHLWMESHPWSRGYFPKAKSRFIKWYFQTVAVPSAVMNICGVWCTATGPSPAWLAPSAWRKCWAVFVTKTACGSTLWLVISVTTMCCQLTPGYWVPCWAMALWPSATAVWCFPPSRKSWCTEWMHYLDMTWNWFMHRPTTIGWCGKAECLPMVLAPVSLVTSAKLWTIWVCWVVSATINLFLNIIWKPIRRRGWPCYRACWIPMAG